MRLLPLDEHKESRALYEKMHADFLKEQARTGDKTHGLGTRIFLIETKDQIVGFFQVQLEEECFPDEDLPEICLKVYGFYINPEERQQHLGRDAFKLMRQWGRDNKAALIETEVNKSLDFSNDFMKEQGLELIGSGKDNIWRGFI